MFLDYLYTIYVYFYPRYAIYAAKSYRREFIESVNMIVTFLKYLWNF